MVKNLRLGIIDDSSNSKKLIELLRYPSSKSNSTSLKDYVSRMKPDQKFIYYITSDSIDTAKNSPFIEEFLLRDLEVLFFIDPIDEYCLQKLQEYENKKLQSITREGLEFGDEENKKKDLEDLSKKFEPLTKYFKNLYPDDLMKVEISNRINKSPLVVVASKYGLTANMERIIKAQALGDDSNNPYSSMMKQANKILEINPKHPIIEDLNEKIKTNDKTAKEMAQLLYETASFRSGYQIKSSEIYGDKVYDILMKLINKDHDKEEL